MTALGHLYGITALGAFLALDGPLAVVRALKTRFIPAGSGVLTQEAAEFAFGHVGQTWHFAPHGARGRGAAC